ncbi:16S rRNA (uracil(1498)-N(3))-methyltransferase [Sphingomonas sp. SUN039]|uniref:16S rRNA (uracil(1498)-N(3))-methyltransferase n=1 Tax=Sphingomonas sp. SUN039 TaxID=2937787 RepID=UPI0021642E99|nr:16S rRNA (uracil(1498)-N(3))-methyltransferase [Sphingomonas sp. SUN039]UVO54954.1 16S rRNA (uracil(1498)-N(3))-methyltransferase [Sphingomonas sp. SUN039]
MPATPAWPLQSAVRLFVETPLSQGAVLTIGGPQAHYLLNVMRMKVGTVLKLFDDATGEWAAEVVATAKRDITLAVTTLLRPREPVPDLWLGAAPIRRARFDFLAEKACELGVARLTPVLTRRAVVDKVKPERLRLQMIEAAEQCGRTALPLLDPETGLADWLSRLDDRTLFFADETGGAAAAGSFAAHPGAAAILVGPEGGFDETERALVRAHPHAVAISLGPRILRAETAGIAAIAAWMAVAGDWPAI